LARSFRFGCQSYAATTAEDWREQARKAERLGFSTFTTADHYIGPGPALEAAGHPVQDIAAIPAMAVAAEATETIRIGCRVLGIDYHQPVVLAKQLATLNFFSAGRLEAGLGAGWLATEYESIGLTLDRPGVRIARLAEVVALVKAFLVGGPMDTRGDHVTAFDFDAVPAGGRDHGATIMIGGGARRVLGLAGTEADIVSVNFDNSSGKLGPASFAGATAEATDQKIEWIKAGAGQRFDQIELETRAYRVLVTDSGDEVIEQMAGAFGIAGDQVRSHPHLLIGSVEGICETLLERRERFGFSYITVGTRDLDDFAPVVDRLAGT
jgi:probable F420-dependent oxidoreductase